MRVDALHRRIADDVGVMYDAVTELFPVRMPSVYERRQMNIRSFIDRLNAACEPFNFFNQVNDDSTMKVGDIILSGLWVAQSQLPDRGSEADVRVVWHMHPDTKRVQWSRYYWNRRRFYFWELMMHEIIHRHQPTSNTEREPRVYRTDASNETDAEQQRYYGNVEEIETHAHDAALEMYVWWPELTLRQACAAAREVKGPTPPTYLNYINLFTTQHPARRHFTRKLAAWHETIRTHAAFYDSLQLVKIV